MSREHKYRVYIPDTNKFVYFGINDFDYSDRYLDDGKYPIQQYTGLTDKNNIEVYDGDIVKINRCYTRPFVNEKQQIDYKFIEGEVEVGKVLWGWNTQKYLVSYEHIRYDDIEDFDKPSHRVEVIGNIFEHKHLLEK